MHSAPQCLNYLAIQHYRWVLPRLWKVFCNLCRWCRLVSGQLPRLGIANIVEILLFGVPRCERRGTKPRRIWRMWRISHNRPLHIKPFTSTSSWCLYSHRPQMVACHTFSSVVHQPLPVLKFHTGSNRHRPPHSFFFGGENKYSKMPQTTCHGRTIVKWATTFCPHYFMSWNKGSTQYGRWSF